MSPGARRATSPASWRGFREVYNIRLKNKEGKNMQRIATVAVFLFTADRVIATEARVDAMGGLYQFVLDDEALVIQDNPAYMGDFGGRAVTEMSTREFLQGGKAYGGFLVDAGPVGFAFYLNNPLYTFPTLGNERDAHGLTFTLGTNGQGARLALRFGFATHQEGDTGFTVSAREIDLSPGLLLPLGAGHLSLFGQARSKGYSDDSRGPDSILRPLSTFSSLGLGARYVGPGDTKLIIGASFYRNDDGQKIGDSTDTDARTGGTLFAGVNLVPFGNSLVMAGLTADGYRRQGNGDARATQFRILAGVGSELVICRWFLLRSNMSKFLLIYRQERMADPDNPYTLLGSSGFVGSFGAGFLLGPARVDATMSEDLLYNGPYFLTGEDSNLVWELSVLYLF